MKTSSWNATANEHAQATQVVLSKSEILSYIDAHGKRFELGYFTALYAALTSLRARQPCVVEFNQVEVYAYDGNTITKPGEFSAALVDFEFLLIQERTQGYGDAITWMQGVVAENKLAAEQGEKDKASAQETGTTA
jgi:hypothetical protein